MGKTSQDERDEAMKKTRKKNKTVLIPAPFLAALAAGAVFGAAPVVGKLLLAVAAFVIVHRLTRHWRFPKGLWRTNKSQQKQNEGEKKQWFPY